MENTHTTSAVLFALAPIACHAASEAKVHCYGINNCKGQNDCKSLFSSCKGQSECKSKGFKDLTLKACRDMGGKLESELKKQGIGTGVFDTMPCTLRRAGEEQ